MNKNKRMRLLCAVFLGLLTAATALADECKHEYQFVAGWRANCHAKGRHDHYVCLNCGDVYIAGGTHGWDAVDIPIDPNNHDGDMEMKVWTDEVTKCYECAGCHAKFATHDYTHPVTTPEDWPSITQTVTMKGGNYEHRDDDRYYYTYTVDGGDINFITTNKYKENIISRSRVYYDEEGRPHKESYEVTVDCWMISGSQTITGHAVKAIKRIVLNCDQDRMSSFVTTSAGTVTFEEKKIIINDVSKERPNSTVTLNMGFTAVKNVEVTYEAQPEHLYVNGEYHEGIPATCTADGVQEYWDCKASYCSMRHNADGKIAVDFTTPRLGHNMTAHAATQTCTEAGYATYYTCSREAGIYYKDQAGQATYADQAEAETTLPPLGHDMTAHAGYAATCGKTGSMDYWTCSREKNVYYKDKDGAEQFANFSDTVLPIDPSLHDYSHKTYSSKTDADGLYWYVCANNCKTPSPMRIIKDCFGHNDQEVMPNANGKGYTTAAVTFTEGHPYTSPVAMHVDGEVSFSRLFSTDDWQTWLVPFDLPLTGELLSRLSFVRPTAVYVDGDGEQCISAVPMHEGETVLGGAPYLVKSSTTDVRQMQTITTENVDMRSAAPTSLMLLSPTYAYTLAGDYTTTLPEGNWYSLESLAFMPMAGAQHAAYRAYLGIAKRDDATYSMTTLPMRVKVRIDTRTEGIDACSTTATAPAHNLMGLRVSDAYKGIVITNGKKVMRK